MFSLFLCYCPLKQVASIVSQPLGVKMLQLFSNKKVTVTEVITSSGEIVKEVNEQFFGDSFLQTLANTWFFCTLKLEGLYGKLYLSFLLSL